MFDQQYPNLSAWILGGDAWIELGQDEDSRSFVRVMDNGGLVWESEKDYKSVDEALADAEIAVHEWMEGNG